MPAVKLTAAQLRVLRAVGDGKVTRSEAVHDLYRCRVEGERLPVTAIVDRLGALHLIDVGAQVGLRRPIVLTAAGRALLDTLNPEGH